MYEKALKEAFKVMGEPICIEIFSDEDTAIFSVLKTYLVALQKTTRTHANMLRD